MDSSPLNTLAIEQREIEATALATAIEALDAQIRDFENTKRESTSKKQKIMRRLFLELIHHEEQFEERCLKEMGISKEELPHCFCQDVDRSEKASHVMKTFQNLTRSLGFGDNEIVTESYGGQSIFKITVNRGNCFNFGTCMISLRKRLVQDLIE